MQACLALCRMQLQALEVHTGMRHSGSRASLLAGTSLGSNMPVNILHKLQLCLFCVTAMLPEKGDTGAQAHIHMSMSPHARRHSCHC